MRLSYIQALKLLDRKLLGPYMAAELRFSDLLGRSLWYCLLRFFPDIKSMSAALRDRLKKIDRATVARCFSYELVVFRACLAGVCGTACFVFFPDLSYEYCP